MNLYNKTRDVKCMYSNTFTYRHVQLKSRYPTHFPFGMKWYNLKCEIRIMFIDLNEISRNLDTRVEKVG